MSQQFNYKPRVNGGLYTGEPARGPWGNVPITPDADDIAQKKYFLTPPPINLRPGNNYTSFPGFVKVNEQFCIANHGDRSKSS